MLKGREGTISRITVSLKYIPIKMDLDPSESINNMGTLRVDVLDAADLPAADRNGYSDPYCKFNLNGKDVHKTKIQKKTLHPAWNEFFECPIKSRTAAEFKVSVFDWDFGDKADLLGNAAIHLELLEPFRPQETTLALDGKSGALRLKMLFKPDYVTRSRQGSSTFSGTFETPGKIVGAPVKGVGKVGGAVGGGVLKGASFVRRGFKGKKDTSSDSNGFVDPPKEEVIINEPEESNAQDGAVKGGPSTPSTPHRRHSSFGAASIASRDGATPSRAETGSAQFLIQSATGYSGAAKIQIHIKQITEKGTKDVFKTKGIKSTDGDADFGHEMFRVNCTADQKFQIVVKDDKFINDRELGEALFFVPDQSASGQEKTIKVGEGNVTLTATFLPAAEGSLLDSPKSRRSFLTKRDRHVSGQAVQA